MRVDNSELGDIVENSDLLAWLEGRQTDCVCNEVSIKGHIHDKPFTPQVQQSK